MGNPVRNTKVSWDQFGTETVLFQNMSKQYFTLNPTMSRIWQLCDGSRDVAALVKQMQAEWPGALELDEERLAETLTGLSEFGLIDFEDTK
ncbi:PqqD family protein [Rhodobacterales bacterium]|nr:PqqD family protein [Rhodobacterales bacterium]